MRNLCRYLKDAAIYAIVAVFVLVAVVLGAFIIAAVGLYVLALMGVVIIGCVLVAIFQRASRR